jgi:hypothetical protein
MDEQRVTGNRMGVKATKLPRPLDCEFVSATVAESSQSNSNEMRGADEWTGWAHRAHMALALRPDSGRPDSGRVC